MDEPDDREMNSSLRFAGVVSDSFKSLIEFVCIVLKDWSSKDRAAPDWISRMVDFDAVDGMLHVCEKIRDELSHDSDEARVYTFNLVFAEPGALVLESLRCEHLANGASGL